MTDPRPTEGELAILRVLWAQGPCTVREVHEALSRTKDTAYTTVLKMMTIMADKGLLARDESERSHRYAALHPEPVVQASLLRDLMQRAFGGSALQLVQRAIDGEGASSEELDAIGRMIAEAKKAKGAQP
ncbi:MAG TPA: BlaI/MecI/CopY family transcriptional regulator [Holophagaceae bacterium]|nr:BlaI/MecI/CopY family transcriptional regulator [Holophagaceae bacterium]